jgi:hypothetical protein
MSRKFTVETHRLHDGGTTLRLYSVRMKSGRITLESTRLKQVRWIAAALNAWAKTHPLEAAK